MVVVALLSQSTAMKVGNKSTTSLKAKSSLEIETLSKTKTDSENQDYFYAPF
jgi:hypothetical protein